MGAQLAIVTEPAMADRERVHCQLVALDPPDSLSEPPEEAIRLLSQQIWESEGRPEGLAADHWARAKAEIAEQLAKMANRPQVEIAQPEAADAAQPVENAPRAAAPEPEAVIAAEKSQAAQESVTRQDDDVESVRLLVPAMRSVVPSIICAGFVLRGVLESPGDLQFDGFIEGEIRSAVLHVGEEAVIEGEVVAGEVTVRGTIRGRVRAHKVLLSAGSRVEGEIWYGALTIENGAQFDASFHRLKDSTQGTISPIAPVTKAPTAATA